MKNRYLFNRMLVFLAVVILLMAFWVPLANAGSAENLENFWVQTYKSVGTNPDLVPFLPESPSDEAFLNSISPELLSFPSLDATVPCVPRYEIELLEKAKPDECFTGLSTGEDALDNFLLTYPSDLNHEDCEDCVENEGQPKVNQAYVWGLTKYGPDIWFGTCANVLCLVLDEFLQIDIPMINDSWVCEQGTDARPPRLFVYHTQSATLEDLTEEVSGPPNQTEEYYQDNYPDRSTLLSTYGIRSAGAHNGVVFFGGLKSITPTISRVVLYAFDAATKHYLGSKVYDGTDGNPIYTNIRQWIIANKELYVGVGTLGGYAGFGKVLRWKGNVEDPWQFEIVGNLMGDPAYLAEHKGRLFASTWTAVVGGQPEGMALYMSPLFGSDQKLTNDDAGSWEVAWKLSDYEVEPTAFQVGGALHSYGAYLYWGTMQVPFMSLVLFYPDDLSNPSKLLADFLGTNRPICIFRGKNFGKNNTRIELLYGTTYLPQRQPNGEWTIVPNNMGQTPKFGLAGFNNFFNNYTWWMELYHGRLFVGTMDWSYLLAKGLEEAIGFQIPASIQNLAKRFYGADLYRFFSLDLPAIPVSLSGAGNYTNYGIRTMVSDDFLYLGMANPMNLLATCENNNTDALGGWELRKLRILDCD